MNAMRSQKIICSTFFCEKKNSSLIGFFSCVLDSLIVKFHDTKQEKLVFFFVLCKHLREMKRKKGCCRDIFKHA